MSIITVDTPRNLIFRKLSILHGGEFKMSEITKELEFMVSDGVITAHNGDSDEVEYPTSFYTKII